MGYERVSVSLPKWKSYKQCWSVKRVVVAEVDSQSITECAHSFLLYLGRCGPAGLRL